MSTETEVQQWRAMHCFLSNSMLLERFLLDVAVPELERLLAEQLLKHWFYIRYDEDGHHLRLRVSELEDEEYQALAQRIQAALQDYAPAPDAPPNPRRSHHGESAVVEYPYHAEIQRYGGPAAMPWSEKLFFVSSRLATEILRKAGNTLAARLAIAADLMTASVAAQDLDHAGAARFFGSYTIYWERFLTTQLKLEPLPPPEDTPTHYRQRHAGFVADLRQLDTPPRSLAAVWSRALYETVRIYRSLGRRGLLVSPTSGAIVHTDAMIEEAITRMLASQIHMMNNRLGLSPLMEVRLSKILERSASAAATADAAA